MKSAGIDPWNNIGIKYDGYHLSVDDREKFPVPNHELFNFTIKAFIRFVYKQSYANSRIGMQFASVECGPSSFACCESFALDKLAHQATALAFREWSPLIMIRNIEQKYLQRPSTTHSGRGGYWDPVQGPVMDGYDRLLAVHLHIVDNYPYLDLVSDVTIRLDGEFITFIGAVRSFYLKQSLLAFAVNAVGTTYIRDEIQVSPVNPLTVLKKSQARHQTGAAN